MLRGVEWSGVQSPRILPNARLVDDLPECIHDGEDHQHTEDLS